MGACGLVQGSSRVLLRNVSVRQQPQHVHPESVPRSKSFSSKVHAFFSYGLIIKSRGGNAKLETECQAAKLRDKHIQTLGNLALGMAAAVNKVRVIAMTLAPLITPGIKSARVDILWIGASKS